MSFRKRLFICGIAVLVSAGYAGSARRRKQSEPRASLPVEVSSNIVFVPVTINGQGPYSFALDSGFQNCAIERTLAKSLNLKVGASQVIEAPGGKVERATISDVALKIAHAEIPNPAVSALDVKQFEPFFGHLADGILGYDVFNAFVVEVDYEHKTLALYDPASFKYKGPGKAVSIDTGPQQPYVIATVAARKGLRAQGRFELDTGSLDAITLNTPFAKKYAIGSASGNTRSVHGRSVGGETSGLLIRLGSVEVGDLRIDSPVSGIVEDAVDRAGQIGAEILRRFTVTFDYSRKRVYLQKNAFFDQSFEIDMAGWFIIAAGTSLERRRIFLVMNDSPAFEAGVREGDDIVSVDDRPVSALSLDELRDLFKKENATRRVRVARDGKEFDIIIRLRKLL